MMWVGRIWDWGDLGGVGHRREEGLGVKEKVWETSVLSTASFTLKDVS